MSAWEACRCPAARAYEIGNWNPRPSHASDTTHTSNLPRHRCQKAAVCQILLNFRHRSKRGRGRAAALHVFRPVYERRPRPCSRESASCPPPFSVTITVGAEMLLNGWKQIASHLGRGVRTVQRWESIGLPVHRPHAKTRSAVVAEPDELDAWIHNSSLRTTELQRLREENAALCAESARLRNENTALHQENTDLRIQVVPGKSGIQRRRSTAAAVKQSA